MSIMFIYGENYVEKQTSSNCKDAVHICCLFGKKCKPGQKLTWVVPMCECSTQYAILTIITYMYILCPL